MQEIRQVKLVGGFKMSHPQIDKFEIVCRLAVLFAREEGITEDSLAQCRVIWFSGNEKKDQVDWPWKHLKPPAEKLRWNFKDQFVGLATKSGGSENVVCRKVKRDTPVQFSEILEADDSVVFKAEYFLAILSLASPIARHCVFLLRGKLDEIAVVFADWLDDRGWALSIEKPTHVISTNYDYHLVTHV